MLPPGHIAAGYLTAKALIVVTHPSLDQRHINYLLLWGMLFGFLPDIDTIYVFFLEKAFTVKNSGKNNHRKFLTHAPILWLLTGLLISWLADSLFWKDIGLLLWLGSWSHFLLDSVEDGIMWLWPFSNKQFALRYPEKIIIEDKRFFPHWWKFTVQYIQTRLTFYLEILIILITLIIH